MIPQIILKWEQGIQHIFIKGLFVYSFAREWEGGGGGVVRGVFCHLTLTNIFSVCLLYSDILFQLQYRQFQHNESQDRQKTGKRTGREKTGG